MPKGKKRRKIDALELLPVNPQVLIPNVNIDEEEKKEEHQEEEKKGGFSSKRNKSKPQPFMQQQ